MYVFEGGVLNTVLIDFWLLIHICFLSWAIGGPSGKIFYNVKIKTFFRCKLNNRTPLLYLKSQKKNIYIYILKLLCNFGVELVNDTC